jgi:O-antigen ligase
MYNKTIDKSMLKNILFALALPIISMSIYNIIMMPDLSSYYFQPYSNPITSGRFGPNQVSTLFGLGIVSILIMQVFKTNLFGSVIIDYSILGLFCILGLLTFSRGGILAAIISFSVSFSYFIFRKQKKILILRNGIGLVFVALISWYIIVSITDGVISQRYGIGKTAYSEKLFIDFTGRLEIYSIDLSIFSDNFLTGVGPGQANALREVYGYGKNVAAHIEYSRMLAEHGVFGLVSLMLLLIIPIAIFNNINNPDKKTIMILFGLLAILTMTHSAMRIAMPCLM